MRRQGQPGSPLPGKCSLAATLLAASLLLFTAKAPAQIYILNHYGGTVGQYAHSGEPINTALISGLRSPSGLALSNGYFYISEEASGVIKKYTTNGVLVNPALITGLYGPKGIAIAGQFLYVANGGGECSSIGKYTVDGGVVNTSLVQCLGNPVGLGLEPQYLYVTEWHNGRVGKYTHDGTTVNRTLIGGLIYPGGIVLDGAGNLFVSTGDAGNVRRYTTSGTRGTLLFSNGFNTGIGLALDGTGHLLVANNFGGAGGNKISKYTIAGQLVKDRFITNLINPVAIAVHPPPPNRAPVARAGEDQVIECYGAATTVALDATGSSDPDGDPMTYTWWQGTNQLGSGLNLNVSLSIGRHPIRLMVADPSSRLGLDTVTIDVVDTTAPLVHAVAAPDVLWPPNGRMVPVTIGADVFDLCDEFAAARIVAVETDEAADASSAWEVTGDLTLNLRARRLRSRNGRTYTVMLEASDFSGNTATAVVRVLVPHH